MSMMENFVVLKNWDHSILVTNDWINDFWITLVCELSNTVLEHLYKIPLIDNSNLCALFLKSLSDLSMCCKS